MDYHLRPLVRTIPSYIKDTTDCLMKVQSLTNLPSNTLLVTLDVSSLYTNIPHEEGIAAYTEALYTRETQSPPTADLAELISEILNKIAFVFREQYYLQVHGTAMGTSMAPSYANLFMAQLERKLLDNASMKPLIWWRYIDDIFAIWCYGEANLEVFIADLNQAHPTIKFTVEWSSSSIRFLDTCVQLENGQLTTGVAMNPPLSRTRSIKHLTSGEKMLSSHGLRLVATRGFHLSSHTTPTSPTFTALMNNNLSMLHASNRLKKAIPELPLIA